LSTNIEHYRRLIAESEFDPSRDEERHKMLLTLLAEEVGQGQEAAQLVCLPPHGSRTPLDEFVIHLRMRVAERCLCRVKRLEEIPVGLTLGIRVRLDA
jgi:hypothetical protein